MSLIKLISELDRQIAAEQKLEDKKKLQLNLFHICVICVSLKYQNSRQSLALKISAMGVCYMKKI